MREWLKVALTGVFGAIVGAIIMSNPEFAFPALLIGGALIIAVHLPDLRCQRCYGRGKEECMANLCNKGYISPRGAPNCVPDTDFIGQDNKIYWKFSNCYFRNADGGRGSVALKFKVTDRIYGIPLGGTTTDVKTVGAHNTVQWEPILVELDKTKIEELKKKLDKDLSVSDLYPHAELMIEDKGEPCSNCKGTGFIKCHFCKGWRIHLPDFIHSRL